MFTNITAKGLDMLSWSHFLLTLCLSISVSSAAASQVVLRSEESRWVVELISESSDGWPVVSQRMTFPSEEEATKQAALWKQTFPNTQKRIFTPSVVSGSLWVTKHAWSEDWERRYAKWIEAEVDSEFFVRYKIATDCADVAYSLRWIFARIHGLPAASRLGGSNTLLTNETLRGEWARLPTSADWFNDRRFLAALNYLLDMTYTHTLWNDSFPVALNKAALISGSYHLSLREQSGHTQLIRWLGENAEVPFLTLNSSVPRIVRSLAESMLFADFPKEKEGAILRFRWAVKTANGITLKSSTEMPGYSREQYSFKSDKDFSIALFEHMGFSDSVNSIREYIYKDIFQQFKLRKELVEEGFAKCKLIDCRPGTVGYENWSTPSRDSRIKGKIASLIAFPTPPQESPLLSAEVFNIEGVSWTLKALIWNWKHAQFDSDPRSSVTQRWGAGGASWGQTQEKFFVDKAKERLVYLQMSRNQCRKQNCTFGSSGWEVTSSNKFDREIASRIKYILGGMSALPEKALQALFSRMSNEVVIVSGQKINLKHILYNSINMNSSASASMEEQWALGTDLSLMLLPSAARPYYDQWLYDQDNKKIFSRTGDMIDVGGAILAAFKSAPVLILKRDNDLELLNLRTGAREILPQHFHDGEMSEEGIIIRSGGTTSVWLLDVSSIKLYEALRVPGVDSKIISGFLVDGSKSYDLEFRKSYNFVLSLEGVFTQSGNFFGFIDKTSGKYMLLDRKLAILAELPIFGEGLVTGFDADQRILTITQEGESIVYFMDESLNSISNQKIQGTCWLENELLACRSREKASFFRIEYGDLKLEMEGQNLQWVTKSAYAKATSDDSLQVFSRINDKLLITAFSVFPLEEGRVILKTTADGAYHIVDLNDLSKPVFTNIFSSEFGVMSEKFGKDLVIYPAAMDSIILWKNYQRRH
ncbi:hypothetical protein ACLWBD_05510 [Bdellovibrio sp. HCB117]|uniref:hypothetical protein n=1 Tax=Bdellovibrio sp. HCB117 TaxID=3394359 RepID=UPI0039B529BD